MILGRLLVRRAGGSCFLTHVVAFLTVLLWVQMVPLAPHGKLLVEGLRRMLEGCY